MAEGAARGRHYRYGLAAEDVAALLLRLKGYRILARRYRTPQGEIDLIVRRGRVTAFVEVKARADADSALQALTPAMRRRIENAARFFLAGRADGTGRAVCDCRFDLVAVSFPFYIRHLDNAWRPDSY